MTRSYRLYQVDAFTSEKFAGNPAGVITNADGLEQETMQRIAREMNCSETAFVLSNDSTEADVYIRYFTPTTEVPVCGHATIAAHYALAQERDEDEPRIVRTKTGAGILPVETRKIDGQYVMTMTQGRPELGNVLDEIERKTLINALSISEVHLDPRCPIQIASTGHSKVMIAINSADVLNGLRPDMASLTELSKGIGCNGYFVFTFDTPHGILTEGRMFAPAIGLAEDPVTGNANGPLGAYLVHHGLVPTDSSPFCFRGAQGRAIGRYGEVDVAVDIKDDAPVRVQISGQAVVIFRASLEL